MTIEIKNLGNIKSGLINLDENLIIFTGPNNTGKSFVTYIIYGLYKIFDQEHPSGFYQLFSDKLIENILSYFNPKNAIERK